MTVEIGAFPLRLNKKDLLDLKVLELKSEAAPGPMELKEDTK